MIGRLLIVISCCISFAYANEQPLQQNLLLHQLQSDLQAKRFEAVDKVLVQSAGSKISLVDLDNLAKKEHYTPLERAVSATKAMQRFHKDIGMSKRDLFRIAYWFETHPFPKESGSIYLPKRKTGLSRTIEYDPKTGLRFISSDKVIGSGAYKVVTKALLYDPKHPELIARCEQCYDARHCREFELTRRLQGSPGVVEARAFTIRKDGKKQYNTIFARLYNKGSMSNVLQYTHLKFSLSEKMQIAHNILRGLEAIQKNLIIHRDLGAANYLLNVAKSRGDRQVDAVIADFGSARFVWEVAGMMAEGHSAYSAPEGIYHERMKGPDYYKTDIFAVGTLLHWVYYEKMPRWLQTNYIRAPEAKWARYKELTYVLKQDVSTRRYKLEKKMRRGKSLDADEQFEHLILKMLHCDPGQRGTPTELRLELESIMKHK
jgi:serine/threonine protein kinase